MVDRPCVRAQNLQREEFDLRASPLLSAKTQYLGPRNIRVMAVAQSSFRHRNSRHVQIP
jgi:hypothetical protein